MKNGVDITGATNSTLKTSNLNNGDAIAAKVMAATGCPEPVISNSITMTVQPILSPTVTINADNIPPWNGGLTVTFTATPTHGGTAPEYQWKRNGQDITGATGATWGVVVNALNDNEDICVVLKSSYECAVPDTAMSNCITTAFTGVVDVVNNKNFKIYPNPVKDNVTITSTERIEKVEIFNLLGQKLLTGYSDSVSVQIDMSGLVSGVYIIKVNDSYISRLVKE
ncbi:MAG: T9SS type A sorting domain-containing protein [Taibaiella sp.]|nr:T9SS type A sorting domain-containing protein [Taibaiella sp.]